MPRKRHIIHSEYPYHVSARSHSGHQFHTNPDETWSILSDYLYLCKLGFNMKIHSFVLMSNHFHLLISTPHANLSEAMNYFMRETSKEINSQSGAENQVWGGRYYRTLVTESHYINHVYKYIYRNPVQAGIVQKCEDYRYSTLHGLLGQSRITVPLEPDPYLYNNFLIEENTLRWLNLAPENSNYECLKKQLRKKELKFPLNRINKRPHVLENGVF
jgi:putative transposase